MVEVGFGRRKEGRKETLVLCTQRGHRDGNAVCFCVWQCLMICCHLFCHQKALISPLGPFCSWMMGEKESPGINLWWELTYHYNNNDLNYYSWCVFGCVRMSLWKPFRQRDKNWSPVQSESVSCQCKTVYLKHYSAISPGHRVQRNQAAGVTCPLFLVWLQSQGKTTCKFI